MRLLRNAALAAAFAALAGAPAAAQQAAPPTNLDAKGGSLSEKLGETHGVIAPAGDVDPAMRKPAPPTGTMPVVKPGDVAPGTAK